MSDRSTFLEKGLSICVEIIFSYICTFFSHTVMFIVPGIGASCFDSPLYTAIAIYWNKRKSLANGMLLNLFFE